MKVCFCKPNIGKEEFDEIKDTLKSGWLTMGPKVRKFEEEFAKYTRARYAAAVDSCTSALHLSLVASGIGPGDEVITSPLTFIATANAILYAGATPVFVDVGLDLNINPSKIEKAVTKKTKAIIPVHYGGEPCDIDLICKTAREHDLVVIEDAAHAIGSKYKGRLVGNGLNPSCFSFYPTKNLASAEGGMITSNNKGFIETVKRLRLFGFETDAWKRYTNKAKWMNDAKQLGFKYNMTDLQAAIGLQQLKKIDLMNHERKEIVNYYRSILMSCDHITSIRGGGKNESCNHLFPILVSNRDDFIKFMNDKGVGTSVHFQPIPTYSLYKKMGYKLKDYPRAKAFFELLVSLPLYSGLTAKELKYVGKCLKGWDKKGG